MSNKQDETNIKPPDNNKPIDPETRRTHWMLGSIVVTLFLLIILYGGLHLYFPAGDQVSPARDAALTSIAQANDFLAGTGTLSGTSDVRSTGLQTGTGTLTRTSGVSSTALQTGTFSEAEQHQLQTLAAIVQTAVAEIPGASANAAISHTLKLIGDETARPQPDRRTLHLLFIRMAAQVKQEGESWFWSTGNWRWLELLFWSIFGTLIYLLTEVCTYYPKDNPQRQFCDKTPWYITTAIKGPFVAMVVLFFLTSLEVEFAGVTLAVGSQRIEVLIFLAGILGFYSRVGKEQLDGLVSYVFRDAWQKAQTTEEMVISPATSTIELDEKRQFSVTPNQDVVWSTTPEARGELTVDGTYTASANLVRVGQSLLIKAMSATDPKKVAYRPLTIAPSIPLQVQPKTAQVELGKELKIDIQSGPTQVAWKLDRPGLGEIYPDGTYKAPIEPDKAGKTVKITATSLTNPNKSDFTIVTLTASPKEPSEVTKVEPGKSQNTNGNLPEDETLGQIEPPKDGSNSGSVSGNNQAPDEDIVGQPAAGMNGKNGGS